VEETLTVFVKTLHQTLTKLLFLAASIPAAISLMTVLSSWGIPEREEKPEISVMPQTFLQARGLLHLHVRKPEDSRVSKEPNHLWTW